MRQQRVGIERIQQEQQEHKLQQQQQQQQRLAQQQQHMLQQQRLQEAKRAEEVPTPVPHTETRLHTTQKQTNITRYAFVENFTHHMILPGLLRVCGMMPFAMLLSTGAAVSACGHADMRT